MAICVFSTYNQASKFANGMYRYTNGEWYIQDQWKVSRRLTLDYGLRFQWIQPQFDAALQTSTFLPERFDPKKAPRLYLPTTVAGGRSGADPFTRAIFPRTHIWEKVKRSGALFYAVSHAGKGV